MSTPPTAVIRGLSARVSDVQPIHSRYYIIAFDVDFISKAGTPGATTLS
jgi:hypothetical protein